MKTRDEIAMEIAHLFGLAEEAHDTAMQIDGDPLLVLHWQHVSASYLSKVHALLWVLGLPADSIPLVGSHTPIVIPSEH